MQSCANVDASAALFLAHGVRRHRVTFQLAESEAGSVVGGHKADCPSYSTRGAIWDIFTVLAHSDWCQVCAGQGARHKANEQVPNQESNAVVRRKSRRQSSLCHRPRRAFLFWARVLVEHGNTVVVTKMGTANPYLRGRSRRSGMSEWLMLLPWSQ